MCHAKNLRVEHNHKNSWMKEIFIHHHKSCLIHYYEIIKGKELKITYGSFQGTLIENFKTWFSCMKKNLWFIQWCINGPPDKPGRYNLLKIYHFILNISTKDDEKPTAIKYVNNKVETIVHMVTWRDNFGTCKFIIVVKICGKEWGERSH